MDEYVKRAAIMEFPIRKDHCDKERANEHFIFGIESVLEYVQNLPAADVAPVVYCKDCAHRTEMGNCGHPRYHGILPSAYPYDFCSCGARMDGDDDVKTD